MEEDGKGNRRKKKKTHEKGFCKHSRREEKTDSLYSLNVRDGSHNI